MNERYPAQIRIESRTDGEVAVFTASGTVYRKRRSWYVQYEERDENGNRSRTILRLAPEEHRLQRSGAVESVMRFTLHQSRSGYYRAGGMELKIETVLQTEQVELNDGKGTVYWEYDLIVGDAPAARHQIKIELS